MRKKVAPSLTKSQVNKAGRNIRAGNYSDMDVEIVENWRASHTYILNTFQANLRRRARKQKNVLVAERLKRRSTIFDKITREPTMALANMQDIAGCRLIFMNIGELRMFIRDFEKARFEHSRVDRDRFNYLKRPKTDGYRGVHHVYEYVAAGDLARRWNGLCIEIQFRTIYQHAWATAVEIVGFLGEGQAKFGRARPEIVRFFQLASEILARAYEFSVSSLPLLKTRELIEEFVTLDKQLDLLKRLEQLSFAVMMRADAKNVILMLTPDQRLMIYGFDNDDAALQKYFELERAAETGSDIVLVRSGTFKDIKNAYRNYFGDARAFVKYMRSGITRLEKMLKKNPAIDKQIPLNLG